MKYLKPLIFTLVLLFAFSISIDAQQHLKFMGIPLTGTIDNFQAKLAQKGIKKNFKLSQSLPLGGRAFNGYFTGRYCTIFIYYNVKSKIVYRAKVVYENTEESVVDRYLESIESSLKIKYNNSDIEYSTSPSGYQIMHILIIDNTNSKYKYSGEIDCVKEKGYYVSNYQVHIDYLDLKNSRNSDSSNMDDL